MDPTPPPQQPITPEKKRWSPTPAQKKITLYGGIIIVLLLIGVGVSAYLMKVQYNNVASEATRMQEEIDALREARKADDPTSDWQTYHNKEYRFEFKYPGDWQFRIAQDDVEKNAGAIVGVRSPEMADNTQNQSIGGSYNYDFVVSFWENINNDFARGGSWEGQRTYSGLADFLSEDNPHMNSPGQTTVDGITGYSVTEGGMGLNYAVMIEREGIYRLAFPSAWDSSKLSVEQKQILSTFRFLDKTDTSSWKTYRNEEYGFEFQYPEDWSIRDDLAIDSEFYILGPQRGIGDVGGDQVNFSVNSNPEELSLEGWLYDNVGGFDGPDESIIVNGSDGIKKTGVGQISDDLSVLTVWGKDNLVFLLTAVSANNVSIQEQVLSTFKFIE